MNMDAEGNSGKSILFCQFLKAVETPGITSELSSALMRAISEISVITKEINEDTHCCGSEARVTGRIAGKTWVWSKFQSE